MLTTRHAATFRSARRPRQRGFTLLEVLISSIIFGTALLGLAQLQINGMRLVKDSANRTQATQLTYQISERMRINWGAATTGDYALAYAQTLTIPNPDCITAACDPQQLAAFDRYSWQQSVRQLLPDGDGQINTLGSGDLAVVVGWTESGAAVSIQLTVSQ